MISEYESCVKKIEEVLGKCIFATLATACDGIVHTRQMCLLNDGLKVFMQTDKTFDKVAEIRKNENVAINCGAYNFTGKAKLIGSPKDNEWFMQNFKAKHLKSFRQYTNLPNEVLIEIEITECKIWEKTLTIVNFIDRTVKKIAYDEM